MNVKEAVEELDEYKRIRDIIKKTLKLSIEKDDFENVDKLNEIILMIEHDIRKLEESRVLVSGLYYG